MKIGSVYNGINASAGSNTEVHNRPAEVKPVSQVSVTEKKEIAAKNLAELSREHEILNDEMLSKSISQANKSLEPRDRRIERAVHEVTHAVMYTIKDTKTDEVIAEFPPRKIQDMIAKMWELAGLFVDEKA